MDQFVGPASIVLQPAGRSPLLDGLASAFLIARILTLLVAAHSDVTDVATVTIPLGVVAVRCKGQYVPSTIDNDFVREHVGFPIFESHNGMGEEQVSYFRLHCVLRNVA